MTVRPLTLIGLALITSAGALAETPQTALDLTSKYASMVNETEYPAASAPASAQTFKLDFSKVYTHRYYYQQSLENHVGPSTFYSTSSGILAVYAEPDQTAQVRFEGLRIQTTTPVNGKPQIDNQKAPATWIGNMNQTGGFDEAIPGQRPVMELLFPVPTKALGVGESVDFPVAFDLPVMGSVYTASGVRHITCLGYVTVGKRVCAKLEQIITVSVVDADTHRRVDARGSTLAYFSPTEGRFVRSAGTMTMHMSETLPSAASRAYDKSAANPPAPSVTSDNFVKMVLAE
jgi:hypothetical protein